MTEVELLESKVRQLRSGVRNALKWLDRLEAEQSPLYDAQAKGIHVNLRAVLFLAQD